MSLIFENEEIRFGDGYPSLIRFFEGDPDKPLVVFFPGWSHLGRIGYGFPGCDEKDFPAHWISKKGYPFLAVSYPIDHPVYSDVYPEFSINDWGKMAADIAGQIILGNKLYKNVIGLNWSASGQVIRPFNAACKRMGINVLFTLGIEASPALEIPSDRRLGIKKTDRNMLSLQDFHYELFWRELEVQGCLNGSPILNKKQYTDFILGDIPVALLGGNEFFKDGVFIEDVSRAFEDKGFFSFTEYPLVAIISGNSSLVPYHPIVDRASWAFLNTRKIYHEYVVEAQRNGFRFTDQKLYELANCIEGISQRLSRVTTGNHFLFVGKTGAKKVADCLEEFEMEVHRIKADISGILS